LSSLARGLCVGRPKRNSATDGDGADPTRFMPVDAVSSQSQLYDWRAI